MKRITILFVFVAAMLTNAVAQDYTHSVGVIGGMTNGFSYKYLKNHFMSATEVGVGFNYSPYMTGPLRNQMMNSWDARVFQNIGGHWGVLYADKGNLSIDFGFGASFGEFQYYVDKVWEYKVDGIVCGVNALFGFEYALNSSPFAFSIDCRPGYGLYHVDYEQKEGFADLSLYHSFDWRVNIAFRYCF